MNVFYRFSDIFIPQQPQQRELWQSKASQKRTTDEHRAPTSYVLHAVMTSFSAKR